jgi:hypothetical protein
VTSGSPNNYTYTWYTGAVIGGTPTYSGKQVNGLDKGTYTVVAVDNADAFCQATETVSVADSRVFTAPIAVQIAPLTNCDVARPNGVASASVNTNGVKDSINYVYQLCVSVVRWNEYHGLSDLYRRRNYRSYQHYLHRSSHQPNYFMSESIFGSDNKQGGYSSFAIGHCTF